MEIEALEVFVGKIFNDVPSEQISSSKPFLKMHFLLALIHFTCLAKEWSKARWWDWVLGRDRQHESSSSSIIRLKISISTPALPKSSLSTVIINNHNPQTLTSLQAKKATQPAPPHASLFFFLPVVFYRHSPTPTYVAIISPAKTDTQKTPPPRRRE